jgi:hypothetical protein
MQKSWIAYRICSQLYCLLLCFELKKEFLQKQKLMEHKQCGTAVGHSTVLISTIVQHFRLHNNNFTPGALFGQAVGDCAVSAVSCPHEWMAVLVYITLTLLGLITQPAHGLRRQQHACFGQRQNSTVTFITSFNWFWYSRHSGDLEGTVLENVKELQHPLIVYHEEDFAARLPGACMVDLRVEFPWLDYELKSPQSGLNRYYNLSGYYSPADRHPRVGGVKDGHTLLLKVASMHHAVSHSQRGSVVFWLDTDVTIREPMPAPVVRWLSERDVTYIPFALGGQDPWADYNVSDAKSLDTLFRSEWWCVESGLLALTVHGKTRRFTAKALDLYRGGLYFLAQACFKGAQFCRLERVKRNLFLNDIFVLSLLLHSDAHNDPLFYADLKHGWFAMKGLPPWGAQKAVWGNSWYPPNFAPVTDANSLVSNFHIGKYVFHWFGYHKKGALSVQMQAQKTNATAGLTGKSWRLIQNVGSYNASLHALLFGTAQQ